MFYQMEDVHELMKPYIFLPLFYMIPQKFLSDRGLDYFPRNPLTVATTEKWSDLYSSKGWQAEVADTWAIMMWPSMNIRGGFTNYSMNDPFILLLYSLPLWAALLAEIGVTTYILTDEDRPYNTMAQAEHNCKTLARRFWNHPALKAKEVYEIVKEHRTHADYGKGTSHVKTDFIRSYYHTRSKYKTISEQAVRGAHEQIPDESFELENIETYLWIEDFFQYLNDEKDVKICKYLYAGLTQKEIAAQLGYANHSGVNKRISKIRRILQEFLHKNETF